jgi:hypothetical protein
MPHRQLEEDVLQSAQDAVLGTDAASGSAGVAPQSTGTQTDWRDWRGATAKHPLGASLLAMLAGAVAATLLRSAVRGRRQSQMQTGSPRRLRRRA